MNDLTDSKPSSAGPTLTKAELAELMFDQVGLNKREAKDLVEGFFEEIRLALERGDEVKLSGFGNFQIRKKPERPGRNPKTGEAIPISARRVVTFHASQKLKNLVEVNMNGGDPGLLDSLSGDDTEVDTDADTDTDSEDDLDQHAFESARLTDRSAQGPALSPTQKPTQAAVRSKSAAVKLGSA